MTVAKKKPPAKPKQKKKKSPGLTAKQIDKIEQDYGLSYALFKAFPELNTLLGKAVKGGWSPNKFQVELRQSNWFKQHSDTWRKNTALKYADPASYQQRIQQSVAGVRNLADSLGISFDSSVLSTLAERAVLFGWDEGMVRDQLAGYVKPSDAGEYGGDLASAQRNLETLAFQNGIKLSPSQLDGWMKAIARGDGGEDEFAATIRNIAATTWSLYGDQIQGGGNLMDIATPYMQSMASTLELNPNELDLFDPSIRRALTGTQNEKGETVPMSVTKFEDSLRQDKRWQYTQGAQDQARGYVGALSKAWGLG